MHAVLHTNRQCKLGATASCIFNSGGSLASQAVSALIQNSAHASIRCVFFSLTKLFVYLYVGRCSGSLLRLTL